MYNFEKLIVWQKAIELCEIIYKCTKAFPKEELFGLTAQMRRAAVSIPLNIAEGSACRTRKEFNHFLHIALGSQFELITTIKLSYKLGFLTQANYINIMNKADEVGKLLHGIISSFDKYLTTKN